MIYKHERQTTSTLQYLDYYNLMLLSNFNIRHLCILLSMEICKDMQQQWLIP